MTLDNEYILSNQKKGNIKNYIVFLYFIPFIFMMFISILQFISPILNNYSFIKNIGCSYIYQCNVPYDNLNQSYPQNTTPAATQYSAFFTGRDERYDNTQDIYLYYDKRADAHFFVFKEGQDISKTYFSNENILQKSKTPFENGIYISYDAAKMLKAGIGDEVDIQIIYITTENNGSHRDVFTFKIEGILRTSSLLETSRTPGWAYTVSDELYDKFINKYEYREVSVFSDEFFQRDNFAYNTEMSKEEQLQNFSNDNLRSTTFIYTLVIDFVLSFVILFLIIALEINFSFKRHKKNMAIFSTMGMPLKQIKRLFIKMNLLNYVISLIIAVLLAKFIYFNFFNYIYVENRIILTLFLIFLLIGVIITLIQSKSIKKVTF
ncbi:MAG: hypothetical protein LBI03_04295 [Clostridiales bacterium]|jgi:hypothetical protein|nr:hypothetical protein [Clostridiales bacterium]